MQWAKKLTLFYDFPFFNLRLKSKPNLASLFHNPHKKIVIRSHSFPYQIPRKRLLALLQKAIQLIFNHAAPQVLGQAGLWRGTVIQYSSPVASPQWTCCQGEKQKEPNHSLQVGRRACLRLCCSKWQWLLTDTVWDHWTPMAFVSLRGTWGGRQVPQRPAGCPSAPTVLSTHMCAQ